ncbi:tRNA (adenosine(37)-N6)-threonylcarbamoyltransferase complex dimerization subunit type 1 TsaB [Sediminicola arcticus]|jgi:tRNA threonylcarbamoyladenosine biosynthesis protein TsaB|uniref:tRNA (Adenosine(37)-N6)-threonylcarbamoyltransferase complex dimerization subunit type 1 TsaB n=1 Tax=Sediminicola arcticus TaxID=1574308 RepID=A0ABV2SPF0_9FLAO
MALILNLETATTNCSVSLAKDGKVISIKEFDSANYSHAEQLHNYIKEVLREASFSLQDIAAVAVSKGPGSYTGLRIGVSAAKGLCFSLDVRLISIPTLESMARQLNVPQEHLIIPVLDARRMEVYSAVYDRDWQEIRSTEAEIITEVSFQSYIATNTVHVIGSGAEKCRGVLDHPNVIFDTAVVPSAREMAHLSQKKFEASDFENIAYFEPFYLKNFILQNKKT